MDSSQLDIPFGSSSSNNDPSDDLLVWCDLFSYWEHVARLIVMLMPVLLAVP